MSAESQRLFVGRKDELAQWKRVLSDPCGQAVLVVGQQGMGKSWLVDEMYRLARDHPKLKCGAVRYEATPNNSAYAIMEAMIEDAFEAAKTKKPLLSKGAKAQWQALFKAIGLIPVVGKPLEAVGELLASLQRNPRRDTREEFIERLQFISGRMPDEGRAVFVIEAEKYLQADSDQDWAIVVRRLPPKIKILFAQRPDDVLAQSSEFRRLKSKGQVIQIPEDMLGVLDEEAFDELIRFRAQKINRDELQVREAVARYNRHPYAVTAALDLIAAGTPIEELPTDPTPEAIAGEQWKKIGTGGASNVLPDKAVALFQAYAVLEVLVPNAVVEFVSELSQAERTSLMADAYLGPMLRTEGDDQRIYHAILADHIREQMSDSTAEPYHRRAVAVYRKRLSPFTERQEKPDALATERLSIHVRAAEGFDACVEALLAESLPALRILGAFQIAITLLEDVLEDAPSDSLQEANILHELGSIYPEIGDLHRGMELLKSALRILTNLEDGRRAAGVYGSMVVVYERLGLLGEAERISQALLDIYDALGDQLGLARTHGNLGLIQKLQGKWVEAENSHRASATIWEKRGPEYDLDRAVAYHNLGILYRVQKMWDKAEEWLNAALEIYKNRGDRGGEANCCGDLGTVYMDRGDYPYATELVQKSFEINKELGRQNDMGIDLMNLGNIAFAQGDVPLAENKCHEAIAIHQRCNYAKGLADCYGLMINIRAAQGNLPAAIECALAARNLYARMHMPREVSQIDRWLKKLKGEDDQ